MKNKRDKNAKKSMYPTLTMGLPENKKNDTKKL